MKNFNPTTRNSGLTRLLASCSLLGLTASGRAQSPLARAARPAPPRSGSAIARPALAAPALDSATGVVHSQSLRSGVPMGGVGAGTFQLLTDGTVGQAAVADNLTCPRALAPGCFLALWTRSETRATARVLALRSGYGLPTVARLDYDGLYPQANLAFPDPALSVQASLLAFSPLVPFDLRNSSFPAVAFILRLKNTASTPIEVSGLLSWESLLPEGNGTAETAGAKTGATHAALIFPSAHGFFGARLGGGDSLPVIAASSPVPPRPTQPQMTITAYPQRAQSAVTVALWDAADIRPGWWDTFAREGNVPDGKPGQSAQFARPAACVAARLTLKPGEAVELPFAVSWYMPHLVAPSAQNASSTRNNSGGNTDQNTAPTVHQNTNQNSAGQSGAGQSSTQQNNTGQNSAGQNNIGTNAAVQGGNDLGHYYQVAFDSADDAAMQLLEDWRSLYGLTEEWQKRLLFSNMPRWMARRMINAAAPLSANTVHTRDGRFAFLDRVGVLPLPDTGDPLQAEREATFAHQSADALLLALFPQLAAQELEQFAMMQDAQGFVMPPAGGNWAARLGPPIAGGGPLVPNASGLFVLPDLTRRASVPASISADNADSGKSAGAVGTGRGRGKIAPSRLTGNSATDADAPPTVLPLPAVAALAPLDATGAYILQAARFLLWTGDPDDVKRFYPSARRAVVALIGQKQDALTVLPPASLTLRLAALKAGAKIARLSGDESFAKECDTSARQGGAGMEARLWNGEFYQNAPRPVSPTAGGSKPPVPAPDAVCASDQLWGQWLAYQLDLGPLVSPDHLLRAAQSVQRRNDRASDAPPPTTPPLSLLPTQGALLPPWQARVDGKAGDAPASDCLLPASLLADASVNIWQDQPEVGVALLRRLEQGRDEVVRSPWQYPARVGNAEAETPASLQSSSLAVAADWNLLYALQGFALDMNSEQMTLAPNIPGTWRAFTSPVFAPTFWGRMEYRPTAHGGLTSFRLDRLIGFVTRPRAVLTRNRAELTLRSLRVLGPPRLENNTVPARFAAYVSVGEKPIGCRVTQDAQGYITLAFDSPLSLTAGDRLEVDVH